MDAKIYTESEFIQTMSDMFKAHASEAPSLMGVEFEHFLIDEKTMRSYDYLEPDGQRDIFKTLSTRGWKVILKEDDNILGLEKDGHTLTLEPGGQIEISLGVLETYEELDAAYQDVVKALKDVLKSNQRLVSIGYHPKSKITDLALLPKERYGYMYNYFKDRGKYCHNMMKGTASTQVSIDYKDEADYRLKNRVAQFLSPVLASLFDATPLFEGNLYKGNNCRVSIWQHTDINRSKILHGSFEDDFGFEAYCKYLLALPPIILKSQGTYHYTEGETLEMLLPKYALDTSDFEHIQSMVFPDVRLKGFLEIRMADAMPYPYNLSVPMIIKAIFYDDALLNKYNQMALKYGEAWVSKANEAILTSVNPVVAGLNFATLKEEILNDVMQVLPQKSYRPIMLLQSIVHESGSVKNWLSSLYTRDKEQFLKTISL
jgi:glutamate--cysteine ligase